PPHPPSPRLLVTHSSAPEIYALSLHDALPISAEDMGQQISRQMFATPRALAVAAGLLIVVGLVPGMPHTPFVGLGLLAAGLAWLVWRKGRVAQAKEAAPVVPAEQLPALQEPEAKELGWDDVNPVDLVG